MTSDVHSLAVPQRERGPLDGIGVVVTRPLRQAAVLAARIASLGGVPIVWPAIVILPPLDRRATGARARAARRLRHRDLRLGECRRIRCAHRLQLARANRHLRARALEPPRHSPQPASPARMCPPHRSTAKECWSCRRSPMSPASESSSSAAKAGASFSATRCARAAQPSITCPATGALRPQSGAEGLVEAMRERRAHALTLTSSEGVDNLVAAVGPAGRALITQLPVFASHPRIAERAREHGLRAVETAGGDAGLLAGVLEWFTDPQRSAAAPSA
jgi:uroporphyrinogen-III synthase